MDVSQNAISDESFVQAAAQAIDALSFAQTHVLDDDFRAHSKSTFESVRTLQQEQRSRIDQTYGARAPSSAFIANQLNAIYRGECASMALAKTMPDGSDNAITAMSHTKCHAFKREMKQLIHEWERAFREEHGTNVSPQDKVVIRPIYELYKSSKHHLDESEARNEKEGAREPNAGSEQTANSGNPTRSSVPAREKESLSATAPSVTPKDSAAATGTASTSPSVGPTAAPTFSSTSPGLIGVTPARDMSDDSLAVEKRYIKRVLYRFESEFERQHGTLPTREDRRALASEYNRYGELKNEIQRRHGEKTTLNAPDGV